MMCKQCRFSKSINWAHDAGLIDFRELGYKQDGTVSPCVFFCTFNRDIRPGFAAQCESMERLKIKQQD